MPCDGRRRRLSKAEQDASPGHRFLLESLRLRGAVSPWGRGFFLGRYVTAVRDPRGPVRDPHPTALWALSTVRRARSRCFGRVWKRTVTANKRRRPAVFTYQPSGCAVSALRTARGHNRGGARAQRRHSRTRAPARNGTQSRPCPAQAASVPVALTPGARLAGHEHTGPESGSGTTGEFFSTWPLLLAESPNRRSAIWRSSSPDLRIARRSAGTRGCDEPSIRSCERFAFVC